MTKREVVRLVFEGKRPPYVPWQFAFTAEAKAKLLDHFNRRANPGTGAGGEDALTPALSRREREVNPGAGAEKTPSPVGDPRMVADILSRGERGPEVDLERAVGNHMLMLRRSAGSYTDIGGGCLRDLFGVVWDRNVDKDIGFVQGLVLPEPTLRGCQFPDPLDPRFFKDWDKQVQDDEGGGERLSSQPESGGPSPPDGGRGGGRFRVFSASYSLYERAWSMRGMENLMMDFYDHPGFVHEFFDRLADFNIAQVHEALKYDIDAVYFGDDWGQQHGLQMGRPLWDEFIRPRVARMYRAVRDAGKFVMNHCCGDVDELFDDLVGLGLNCFNPFQPEVMDVDDLLRRYRGRLAFFGGLSTQKTLPYGTTADVRRESQHLLTLGREGGYIFAPAHAVEGDVPLENMLAFIEEARGQSGAPRE